MKRPTMTWTLVFLLGGLYLTYRAATYHCGSIYVQDTGTDMVVPATAWDAAAGTARLSVGRTAGTWVAAFFTLAILSFLYQDNPFYKVAEAVVVGVSAGYWMVVGFWTTIVPNLFGKLDPAAVQSWAMPGLTPTREPYWFTYFMPLILGIMLLWRLLPRGTWIARWPLALIVGTTAGIRLLGFIQADFLSQIRNTIRPLLVVDPAAPGATGAGVLANIDIWTTLANLTLVVGVLSGLVYFFFSTEHRGLVGRIAKLGIWFLMITFGAGFGYTVMGRIALLAARFEFLLGDWLWLIDPTGVRPPGWSGW